MLGYKGFKSDLTCRGFQYEIGKTYTMDPQDIKLCSNGFHFCQIPIDVLTYYDAEDNLYAVIKAEGNILHDEDKSVTNQLTILHLVSKDELMKATSGSFVRSSGLKEWYQNGLYHRLDGPARECSNGDKEWYHSGLLHRLDGPSGEFVNGHNKWTLTSNLYRF